MVSANTQENNNNSSQKKKTKTVRRVDTYDFRTWLSELNLGVLPTIHVNGAQYPTAVVSVDFGSPVQPVRLTAEQSTELNNRIRRLVKDIYGKDDLNVRISNDSNNGIYWASVGQ